MNLFAELKRRNVFRVAAVYLAVGWLLVQIAASMEAALALPLWFDAMVVALLAIGFVPALIFAWAFELTPEGLKKTAAVAPGASVAARTGRKLDYVFLAAAGVLAVLFAADRLAPRAASGDATPPAALATAGSDERSIAVLPFVDLSPDRDQEYFADGLSEELLNVLARSQDLKVAGRTSSFAFKGQNRDLREVGEILNVAHILEGSVRKSGARIRVSAQLIKASDGYHVFSETYDRELKDIFAVQDDIAGKIGAALKARLAGETASENAPAALEAYDLYLLGRQRIYTRDPDKLREAEEFLARALAIDPDYAPALAQKAVLALLLSDASNGYGDTPFAEAAAEAQRHVDRALKIAPDLAEAHAALGLLRLNTSAPFDLTISALERALALNPNLSDAHTWLANAYARLGRSEDAIRIYEGVVERDPLFRPAFSNLVNNYSITGEYAKTEAVIARVERIIGDETEYTLLPRGLLALDRGELAEAVTRLKAAYGLRASSNVLRTAYTGALVQIGELDAALAITADDFAPIVLQLLGRHKEAADAVDALSSAGSDHSQVLNGIFFVGGMSGRYSEMAAYMERNFGTAAAAAAGDPVNAAIWAGPLAQAYKKLGRNAEFAEATDVLEKAAELGLAGDGNAYLYWHPRAEAAALKGDADSAVAHLRTAMARGYLDINGFYSPAFDDIRGDPRFAALEAEMRAKANQERAKLGLAPR